MTKAPIPTFTVRVIIIIIIIIITTMMIIITMRMMMVMIMYLFFNRIYSPQELAMLLTGDVKLMISRS